MTRDNDSLDLLADLIARAKRAGADAADAVAVRAIAISYAQRLGHVEKVERSEGQDLGLRVFVGRKQAVVSSSDQAEKVLNELVERAVSMARAVPDDPHCGLADPEEILAGAVPDLDIVDPDEPSTGTLEARVSACEAAAMAVDGVTNSEGAEASWSLSDIALAASNGFAGAYRTSGHGFWVAVLAGEGTGMERDYDSTSATFASDLDDPAFIGRNAGERAVARLKPRKVKTRQVPVVYAPRVSNGLVRHLAGAANGTAIARGTSFLAGKMGERIFAEGIHILDDPHRKRGHRSKPFDAEGLPNAAMHLVEDGVLTNWVLDLATARKLGLKSNGRGARGTSSPPSPSTTNLYMAAGKVPPDALIADIEEGFYVTELMGMGVNTITGDYSRGASGFWIEKGKVAYPVSEVTVAGILKDMFLRMTPADDLRFKYGTDAPTIRIEGMTVAGN